MWATRTVHGQQLTPGVNVDPVDLVAGLRQAAQLGYSGPTQRLEIEYNLMRWARGEEGPADHSMSASLSGISYTDWRAILAAAIASGQGTRREEGQ